MQRGLCSAQSFRNPGPFHQLVPPSPASLHGIPTSLQHREGVCEGLHTRFMPSLPTHHKPETNPTAPFLPRVQEAGNCNLDAQEETQGGLGNTQHSLPLHHFIHENSEVQRGAVIIPRSHSWPAPRSIDFPSTKYSLYPW